MHVLNSSGRQVSLLNEEPTFHLHPSNRAFSSHRPSYSLTPARRGSSASETPELLRSDSYDSHSTAESISPLTPLTCDYPRPYDYLDNKPLPHRLHCGSYDDDATSPPATATAAAAAAAPERAGKRYPCRYRESRGCEKTFTTSGHASRHSKIHTAEKAVHCTYAGCTKKFTRADNMKQHLETHFKDKSRSSKSVSSASTSRRSSASSRTNSVSNLNPLRDLRDPRDPASWDAESPYTAPLLSPGQSPPGNWGGDLKTTNIPPFVSQPIGLDALAFACQQEAGSP